MEVIAPPPVPDVNQTKLANPGASDALGTISYPLYPVFTIIFIIIAFMTIAKIRESKDIDIAST
ncbi:hypothetical protein DMB44_04345 [Thermoplasma sp. Kam2015]|uniref:hypothetical protein n=1 Tax=Thermoplasma sp. Kam2015 TaxID=2094122 RepID=UPI000D842179|nr:hypothetical protein [Thermoplasma sp. Kam2015]PYB68280.1 hypothetical protein DMB44_04345 [Thermoplasma sp. Kam2015]